MSASTTAVAFPTAPAGFKTYPLKALYALDSNVRKKRRTPEAILAMASSIAAHGGLLQNLVVVPELMNGRPTGRAGVTAGETRRLALCLLRDGGLPDVDGFDDDFPVPVLEVAHEEALAASATENIQRTAMHPADQFLAFRELHEQCGSIEQVADFFGVTPLVVRQRLKLAHASPALFEVYRNDGMTLDQLMALSITDDHAAQEKVWTATKQSPWDRAPDRLKSALTQREVGMATPIARFVGLKAYEAAGGQVRRDLFAQGDEDAGFLVDVDLLQQLAEAKLAKTAEPVRAEGWGWVEVRTGSFNDSYHYGRAAEGRRALTPDEQAGVSALEGLIAACDEALEKLYDAEDTGDTDQGLKGEIDRLEAELAGHRRKLEVLEEGLATWAPAVQALAGAIVFLDRHGKVQVDRALVRPADRKAAAAAAAKVAKPVASTQNEAQAGPAVGPSDDPDPATESESLTRRLTAHRTVALQRLLADNTQVALAALAHNLVQRMLHDSVWIKSCLGIKATGCGGQLDGATVSSHKDSRAWRELQALVEVWGERIPGDQDKLLPWLIRLPLSELCDLLALCTALTLNANQSKAVVHEADPVAEALGLDMADWWTPDSAEYLSLVPKAQICRAVAEAGMGGEAAGLAKLKKGECVSRAEALLAGKRWLPKALRR